MSYDQANIEKCKRKIEAKLGWGESNNWQTLDYENLSERIFNETGVLISSSTLKRIWGKVKYDSAPKLSTLNALSQFIGYQNWRAFAAESQLDQSDADKSKIESGALPSTSASKVYYYAIIFAACALVAFAIWSWQFKRAQLVYPDPEFGGGPVTRGLPATVIFHYNVSQSNADSVFIQQDWNKETRTKVDKTKREFTSTYFYPGYFRAKLILNDSLVDEHDLLIVSWGWIATIETENAPIYLDKPQIARKEGIEVTLEDLISAGVDFESKMPRISFFDVKTKIASSDNFVMDVELRSMYNGKSTDCQMVSIDLLCSEGLISIPLSTMACTGEATLVLGDKVIKGETNNLSAFGVDFDDWVKLKCEVKHQVVKIFVNEKIAYEEKLQEIPRAIFGTRISFTGPGAIKKFKLANGPL